MKRKTCLVPLCAAAALIVSQMSGGALADAGKEAEAQSVRPTNPEIRTSVNQLLGWRVGVFSSVFPNMTFVQSVTLADALGLASIGGDDSEQVSPENGQKLDFQLSPDNLAMVKAHLAAARVRMTAYRVHSIPGDDESRERLFAFAKQLGVETVVTRSLPEALSQLDECASRHGLNVAVESEGDPKELMKSLQGLSPHVGVSADLAAWLMHGIRPVDGLDVVKDRLMVVLVRDRSVPGPDGHDVRLGTGAADLQKLFYRLAEQEPQPQEQPNACVNCSRPYSGTRPLFVALDVDPWQIAIPTGPQPGISGGTFADLWQEAGDLEKILRPAMGYRVEQDARLIPPTTADRIPADVKQKIEAALPRSAAVAPKKQRKLLVVDLCPAGGYYHDTVAHANFAIEKMAQYTGAYQPVFSNDLNNLKYPNILKYDAVFLNSVVGELFSDPDVLNGLMRFVREGGGLAGLHGSSYASMDIPEFGELIGAQSGPHHVETATLKIDDPNSPLTKQFASSPLTAPFDGKDFTYTDEFYHFLPTGPFSRQKLHVLISIDANKTDLSQWHVRPDRDYGSVWIKRYGAGRVFNCALGHTPTFFETPALAQMVLNAIQFVLGDLPADTTPSAMLGKR